MSNEFIFLTTVILDFLFVLLLYRLGKYRGLVAALVINIVLVSVFGTKLITIFGYSTNAANGFYACIFLITNAIVEYKNEQEARRIVWVGFAALSMFVLMSQFVVQFTGNTQTLDTNNAMEVLFVGVPRIALASMIAYLIAQHFNIWFFGFLKHKLAKSTLWLRNITSSCVSEVIDSLIFFSIAFFGLIPGQILLQTMLIGFALKALVAIVSTPFIYMIPVMEDKEIY